MMKFSPPPPVPTGPENDAERKTRTREHRSDA